MAETSKVEELTPLDLLMPRIYVVVTLTFRTTKSIESVAQHLQPGLNRLVKPLPWLSGRVFVSSSEEGKPPTAQIRWKPDDAAPTLVVKGSIEASYQPSSAKGMPPAALPTDTWPVPSMVDASDDTTGAPVFAASLFRFADNQGVGLCVCIHHYAVDATALGEIIRLWAQNVAESTRPGLISPGAEDRSSRLREAVSPALSTASSQSMDEIYASHPEYSRTPPALPDALPSCAFKMFKIRMIRLFGHITLLGSRMPQSPTTNTLLCALMWSSITRARRKRDATLDAQTSQLTMAVNARRRIKEDFSTPQNPYFGNAVLIAHSQLPVADMCPQQQEREEEEEEEATTQALVKTCEAIAASTQKIDARYVADVYSLVERTEDYRTVYAGWDLFGARDLTITSWASLDLYETEFGGELGRPEFVRVPPSEIDGICGILPRRRVKVGAAMSDEVLEVIVTLRTEDMAALEEDVTWRRIAEEV